MKKILSEIRSLFKLNRGSSLSTIILCAVAATIFWFFNALNKNYSTNLKYPVKFVYDTENYLSIGNLPESILINVSGVGWNLLRKSIGVKVTPISIVIENPLEVKKIPGITLPGTITDQITDIELNYILTDTLFIHLDKRVTKSFSLKVDSLSINLNENYIINSPISLSEDSVTLTGPNSFISEIPNPITLSISEKNLDDNFSEEVQISVPNYSIIKRNPPTVTISFTLAELIEESIQVPINRSGLGLTLKQSIELQDSTTTIRYKKLKNGPVFSINDFDLILLPSSYQKSDSTALISLIKYPENLYYLQIDSSRISLNLKMKK